MLQKLNTSFKSIFTNPFNQEAWAEFDLACIHFSRQDFVFKDSKDVFNNETPFLKNAFDLKSQLEFIYNEKKRALDLQFFDYLNQLLKYESIIKAWKKSEFPAIKIYKADYFIQKEHMIHYRLSSNTLLDIKASMILTRRCRLL